MKALLSIFLLSFISVSVNAQAFSTVPIDTVTNKVSFVRVATCDSIKKDLLFEKARKWFIGNYVSYANVIQVEDRVGGILVANAMAPISTSMGGMKFIMNCYYTISVQVKDGKYRVEVTNIYYANPENQVPVAAEGVITDENIKKKNGQPNKSNLSYRDETLKVVNDLIQGLQLGMNGTPSNLEW